MRLMIGSDCSPVEALLDKVDFNVLFARTVTRGCLAGAVYVDDPGEPTTALIVHPYGMSFLVGDTGNQKFNEWLRSYMLNSNGTRKRPEWMQVHPHSWKPVIEGVLGPGLIRKTVAANEPAPVIAEKRKVVELTRVNFTFRPENYRRYLESVGSLSEEVVRTTREMFAGMRGHVIPRFFWRDADHFAREGTGFSMMVDGQPVSTAFSAFVQGNILELGIETLEGHRGKGHAEQVSRALLNHCIENRLEPIWSCRLENRGSFNLAKKLGFEPTLYIPFYQLVSRI